MVRQLRGTLDGCSLAGQRPLTNGERQPATKHNRLREKHIQAHRAGTRAQAGARLPYFIDSANIAFGTGISVSRSAGPDE